jgi:FMNH2-dependent dimethyl sulfone monooxygenase
MNAGLSPAGRHFAAKHADSTFVAVPDIETGRTIVSEIKAMARKEFGREILVFLMTYIVCAETEREAKEFVRYYVHEKGDWKAVRDLLSVLMPNSQSASREPMGVDGCRSHSGLRWLASRWDTGANR